MAQMTEITGGWLDTDRIRLGRILNVDRPTCRWCANKREDVMLVQVLLNKACGSPPPGGPFQWARELPALEPDGVFGRKTNRWVRALQSDPVYGQVLHCDGRIDPATSSARAPNGHAWTIYVLNAWAHSRDARFLANLHRDPSVPPLLRAKVGRALELAGV
jgi:hypothetical protein